MFSGAAASGGKAFGIAAFWGSSDSSIVERAGGTEAQERALLAANIQRAKHALATLAYAQDKDAKDIIGLQIALLEDDTFLEPVFARVKSGMKADIAWETHLDQEIDNYAGSEDRHFQSIAHDLVDLKKRMLRLIRESPHSQWTSVQQTNLILLADDISPSDLLSIDRAALSGLALIKGSLTNHVAVLARGRGIPLIVGCPPAILFISNGSPILLDADNNIIAVNPDGNRQINMSRPPSKKPASPRIIHKADAKGSHSENRTVNICLNIDGPEIIQNIDVSAVDGIGLFRTEFLITDGQLPDENEQFEIYRSVLDWSRGKQVVIRTFDFGGDKVINGLIADQNVNPFLGVRGYRLSRMYPDLFRGQLKALARAAPYGNLAVMIPMVTAPFEMSEFKSEFQDVVAELGHQHIRCALPKLGMMIEVPSAALTLDRFDADFYSIGSNDLIQYVSAVSRDTLQLDYLADAWEPSIYRLLRECVSVASAKNVPISICGEIASLPKHIPNLLDCGIRSLSVSPGQVEVVRHAIGQWHRRST